MQLEVDLEALCSRNNHSMATKFNNYPVQDWLSLQVKTEAPNLGVGDGNVPDSES